MLDDGVLTNGLWQVRFSTQGRAPDLGTGAVSYEERWLPIARWSWSSDGLAWSCEAVPFPARGDGDSVLAVSLEWRVTNTSGAPRAVDATAGFETMPEVPAFVPSQGSSPPAEAMRWATRAGAPAACGWTDMATQGARAVLRIRLAAGETRVSRMVLASEVLDGRALSRIARASHSSRRAEVRAAWRARLARGARIELGDPEVERALWASTAMLLCCRERIEGHWFPTGGPFQYHDVWLRDACRAIAALSRVGFTREAREMAEGLLTLQLPQGPFVSQRGQLDGTGQALWAFEQAVLRPKPDSGTARFARSAAQAVAWGEAQRKLGENLHGPYARMLPFADPRDNELVRAQLVGNDIWMIRGYESAARLAAAGTSPAEPARIRGLRDAYVHDFVAALARTGSADVPPSWQLAGRDWGNLAVAWPGGVLPAGDPRCDRLASRIWAAGGGAGLVSYADRDSLHGYLGADLGIWAMLAGRTRAADSVLAAMLHWRDATGAGAELFSRSRRDFGRNFPPHPTFAAALLQHVLCALVYDDGDDLLLTMGARRAWWRGARSHAIPTRWGVIDLSFSLEQGVAKWQWTPVPVPTILRLPPGTRPAAGANLDVAAVGDGFEVRVPARQQEVSLRVEEVTAN